MKHVMTKEEIQAWLDANTTVKKEPTEGYWDSLEGYEYLPWKGYRVSGIDQYGRKQYEFVSGHGFFPKRGKRGTS